MRHLGNVWRRQQWSCLENKQIIDGKKTVLKIMWDENILNYVHFETAQFIASHVLHRIEEIMDQC